jgi:RHS repeat-associated protein
MKKIFKLYNNIKQVFVDSAINGFDYLGSLVYTNNNNTRTFESTSFGGGRINKTSNSYVIDYYITDHLGSTRAIVNANNGEITAQYNYYPFGKQWEDPYSPVSTNRYTFSGKEKQTVRDLGWLDFSARMLETEFGRWPTPDPLAEKYYSISPYAYCAGNPVKYIDPDGMSTHLNRLGYIVQENDDNDDGVYYHNDLSNWDSSSTLDKSGNGINHIGYLGGTINIDDIYANLLEQNISTAKSIWNPFTFRNLVKTNGEWDLKNNKNTIYGKGNDGQTIFLFQGEEMESQDVGNHHFGVVSKAYNIFSEEFILRQAGQYQIKSGTSKPEWQIYIDTRMTHVSPTGAVLSPIVPIMQPPYGDDPRDQKWITSGFNYYKNKKRNK